MTQTEIQHTAVPIDHVSEGVEGLRIAFVNVFGVRHTDHRWTLIDAGIPYSATLIRNWADSGQNATGVDERRNCDERIVFR